MEANRERILVGLFVLIAAGLFLGTMVMISGGLSGGTVPHRAYFKFAGGVQPGAPVRYGGMLVGKVQRVRVDPGNTSRIENRPAGESGCPRKDRQRRENFHARSFDRQLYRGLHWQPGRGTGAAWFGAGLNRGFRATSVG